MADYTSFMSFKVGQEAKRTAKRYRRRGGKAKVIKTDNQTQPYTVYTSKY